MHRGLLEHGFESLALTGIKTRVRTWLTLQEWIRMNWNENWQKFGGVKRKPPDKGNGIVKKPRVRNGMV